MVLHEQVRVGEDDRRPARPTVRRGTRIVGVRNCAGESESGVVPPGTPRPRWYELGCVPLRAECCGPHPRFEGVEHRRDRMTISIFNSVAGVLEDVRLACTHLTRTGSTAGSVGDRHVCEREGRRRLVARARGDPSVGMPRSRWATSTCSRGPHLPRSPSETSLSTSARAAWPKDGSERIGVSAIQSLVPLRRFRDRASAGRGRVAVPRPARS